jgi:hypothetical protein
MYFLLRIELIDSVCTRHLACQTNFAAFAARAGALLLGSGCAGEGQRLAEPSTAARPAGRTHDVTAAPKFLMRCLSWTVSGPVLISFYQVLPAFTVACNTTLSAPAFV